MNRHLIALLGATVAAASLVMIRGSTGAAEGAVPPALPWCTSATDALAQRLVVRMQDLASSMRPPTVRLRDSLASLPMVPPEQVFAVADETLCQKASQALDSLFFTAPRGEPLYLIKVGPRYVAHPTSVHMGEFGYLVHLNSGFTQMLAVSTW